MASSFPLHPKKLQLARVILQLARVIFQIFLWHNKVLPNLGPPFRYLTLECSIRPCAEHNPLRKKLCLELSYYNIGLFAISMRPALYLFSSRRFKLVRNCSSVASHLVDPTARPTTHILCTTTARVNHSQPCAPEPLEPAINLAEVLIGPEAS